MSTVNKDTTKMSTVNKDTTKVGPKRADLPDLTSFGPKQLDELVKQAEAQKAATIEQARAACRDKLVKIAEQDGFNAADLFRVKRVVAPPKFRYQNPSDKTQTWTGRGKMPSWLKSLKDSGKDISKFQVSA